MSEAISDSPLFQHALYIGNNIQNILYGEHQSFQASPRLRTLTADTGVELVLYIKTMQLLLGRGTKRKKSDIFYACFSSMMCFLITIWVATQALFGEEMWIVHRTYQGGPSEYWADHISAWYMDFGTTAVITLQLMTDGLMVSLIEGTLNNLLTSLG